MSLGVCVRPFKFSSGRSLDCNSQPPRVKPQTEKFKRYRMSRLLLTSLMAASVMITGCQQQKVGTQPQPAAQPANSAAPPPGYAPPRGGPVVNQPPATPPPPGYGPGPVVGNGPPPP